ncbi:MAG TPA: zf-HC2 domain-containing protein [Candidatus Acidoferrum sp.]|nr:zf-HC2 domain-containing protein [Candidatus Acidoferrum sp.]
MTWTCEQIEARLSDYLEDSLTAEERHAFDVHANTCENCTRIFSSVSRLVGNLHSMEQMEPSAQLVNAILDKTIGPREVKRGWRGVFGWLGNLGTPRFAYSAVSIAATFVILLAASGVNLRKPKLADLSPANMYRSVDRQAHLVYARSTKFVSDLRVVYEIQSRLNKDSDLPGNPQTTMPQSAPGKAPGSTDDSGPAVPRQQNRADSIRREFEELAAEVPNLGVSFCGRMINRRNP